MMEGRQFAREFKLEAVKLVEGRGVTVKQAACGLNVHENVLRKWVKEFAADPQQAFPGPGRMKPELREIERLRREVQKRKAERDISKKAAGLLREGIEMKFAFIAKHRGIWPTEWLCGALGISKAGFYAWLTRSRSQRTQR
jgi:transposase-like protein